MGGTRPMRLARRGLRVIPNSPFMEVLRPLPGEHRRGQLVLFERLESQALGTSDARHAAVGLRREGPLTAMARAIAAIARLFR